MATQTHERKLPPSPPSGKKRRRGKRQERRAQVDLDVQNVDSSPESVEKRRESQSSPGAPGVPVVVPAEGSDKQSAAEDDDEPGGFEIIWAVEDEMVLETADDEEARHVHVDRLWQLAAEMDLVDDEPMRHKESRYR